MFRNYILIFCVGILVFSSCTSKNIGNAPVKGLKGLLTNPDCHGPCGQPMACEGKELTFELELRNNNVMTSGNAVFFRDPDNYDYTFRVNFNESVPPETYADIKNPNNKRVVFTGVVEGFDQYVHEVCTRSYIFKVTDKSKFIVYDK